MIVSVIDCGFYRFAGILLICISLMGIIINIRYFIHRCHRRQRKLSVTPLSAVFIGMLASSTLSITTSVPFTLIQCFTCRPIRSHGLICQINGFICFFNGTFNMYILVHLSLCRYLNTLHKHSLLNHFLVHNPALNILLCALLAFCWTVPPLFNIGNTYTIQGVGFHCSLDWNNSAFRSRLFILSLLICNYFLLLFFLIYANVRIYFVLRTLVHEDRYFHYSSLPSILCCSRNNTTSSSSSTTDGFVLRKHRLILNSERRLSRLQLLKVDQHYARITAIMVTQFTIAWTPYAVVALLTFDGRNEFIRQQQIASSVCALLAKISIILNPLIFMYTNKVRRH